MIEGWKQVKLADYYTIHSGLSKPAEEFGFGYPFLSFSDIFWNYFVPEELSQLVNSTKKEQLSCSVKKGDVFLTRTSETIEELGMSCVALKDYPRATFNGFAKRLRPINNKDLDPKFIGFYLRSPQFRAEITAYSTLTTRASLNNGIIERLRINLPQLTIQRKISSILSAYEDLIENNLQRIKLLEEMAQQTYTEWFVRMKFPGHESVELDDETGLPEGWEEIKLGEACNVSGGGTPSRAVDEYWKNGDITWFSPTDLSKANSFCLLDSSDKITDLGLIKSSTKLMHPNSFMMTSRATIGLFGLIDKPFTTNQGFINVTPKKPVDKYFLFFNFRYRVPEFYNHASGATFPEISKSKFKFLKIVWPTEDILIKFDVKIKPIISTMMNLTVQNQNLKEARDILLPRLMTGMIEV